VFLNEWNQSLKLQEHFAVQLGFRGADADRREQPVPWGRHAGGHRRCLVAPRRGGGPPPPGFTRAAAHQTGRAVAQAAHRAGRRPAPAGTPRRREREREREREGGRGGRGGGATGRESVGVGKNIELSGRRIWKKK